MQMGDSENGQGDETAADGDVEASALQQLAVQQDRTRGRSDSSSPTQASPTPSTSSDEAVIQQASTPKPTAKKASAKKALTKKASAQPSPRSYKSSAGNIHFDILIAKRVLQIGGHLLIFHSSMPDVTARMVLVNYVTKTRLSSWSVYCEELDIDGEPCQGTGPQQWLPGLAKMGFTAYVFIQCFLFLLHLLPLRPSPFSFRSLFLLEVRDIRGRGGFFCLFTIHPPSSRSRERE